ncbi:MAG: DUF2252 family protein [Anaerolineae bacterium]|nr:DUF2252 family protein [Phycisphaerae bacterium]
MRSIHRLSLSILIAAFCCASARGQAVYDTLDRSWSPYLSKDDPAAFAMKIRAVSATPRSYWGGAKDLFFIWAKRECADWFVNPAHQTICHADVHAGNIGTYASGFGQLSIGLVDFDDAVKLPVEIDLLQAFVSLRLAAMQNQIELSDASAMQLCELVVDTYNVAAKSSATATDLLSDEPSIAMLLKAKDNSYAELLAGYTANNQLRRAVLNRKGEVKEILTPAMDRADALAAAIAESAKRSSEFGRLLRVTDRVGIRRSIKHVAIRTRLGSAGSQGLDKVLVLMDRPLRDVDHDVILYLKQEVPTAAERADAGPRDSRPPSERVREAVAANCDPDPIINAPCDTAGRSYLLTLFEPWGAELENVPIANRADLVQRASIMGVVLGCAHRLPIEDRHFVSQLSARSKAYLGVMLSEWESLRNDPRTTARIAEADAFIESARQAK